MRFRSAYFTSYVAACLRRKRYARRNQSPKDLYFSAHPFRSWPRLETNSELSSAGNRFRQLDSYSFQNVVIGGGGGFVPGIVFSTSQPNLIYARTDIGGAYRWDPSTNHWIPLLDWIGPDDWNLTGVESIAADPIDPRRVYLAVGTYTNEWTSQNGAILRSSNYGQTFQRFDLPFKVGGNMPGRNMGERLAIDPNNNSILYLGTRSGNGLWRSTDHGQTWSKVSSFPDAGPYFPDPSSSYTSDPIGVVWVTFDPHTLGPGGITQTIYVGVADLGNSAYRSTDGGKTWGSGSRTAYRLSASSRQAGVERHALYQLQQRSRALRWQQRRCLEVRHFERNLDAHQSRSIHRHRERLFRVWWLERRRSESECAGCCCAEFLVAGHDYLPQP